VWEAEKINERVRQERKHTKETEGERKARRQCEIIQKKGNWAFRKKWKRGEPGQGPANKSQTRRHTKRGGSEWDDIQKIIRDTQK